MKKLTFVLSVLQVLFILGLNSCTDKDPCESVSCENGGTCINGTCDCPEGYSGINCGNQITPSAINILDIKLTKFPSTKSNGAGWDSASGPDITIAMGYNNDLIYQYYSYYENAVNTKVYNFKPDINLAMDYPTDKYVILLVDYDGGSDYEYIGGIEFVPYQNDNGFPEVLKLDDGNIAFELTFKYNF